MSGLRERIRADYEQVLLEASYRAFVRGEVGEDHMLDLLLPVIGAVLVKEHRGLSVHDQNDLVSAAIESVLLELRRVRCGQVHIVSPLTYFYSVARNRMLHTLSAVRTQVIFTNGALSTSRIRNFEDVENDILLVQLSVLGYNYCLRNIRFHGVEREICGYALSKLMSGSKPSVPYIGQRYQIQGQRANFFVDYATVLYRMARQMVQQEVV